MNKKIIIVICLLAVLATTLAYLTINIPSSPTAVFVDPPTATATVSQNFTINVNISNVVDLYGWRFKLKWNPTILDVINVTEGGFLQNEGDTFFFPTINNTIGYIDVDCTLLGDIKGVNGSGILATIQFHVRQNGSCILDLYDTMLLDSLEQPQLITHTVNDGHFST